MRQHLEKSETGLRFEPAVRFEKQKILIVDDSPEDIQLLMESLGDEYLTVVAMDGEQALALAGKEPAPDLILLDIRMPGMDGFEVCQRLERLPQMGDTPIIFLSSLESPLDKVKAFRTGGVDYITKPFHEQEVQARVGTHLMLKNLRWLLREQNRALEKTVAERTRELEEAYRQLAAIDRIKGDFLRMISHEMRTPLNGILGISELAFELCPPCREREEYLRYFQQSRRRMEQLLEDSLLLDTLESRDTATSLADFRDILAEAVAGSSGISVSISRENDLADCRIRCDHQLLKRALVILIQVAAAFAGRENHASVTAGAEGSSVTIRMPMDAFTLSAADSEAFFRLASDVRGSSKAQGLGLAPVVAERIVHLFGGSVQIIKGEGATGTITVSIPRSQRVKDVPKERVFFPVPP